MKSTTAHYIRCLKPNDAKTAGDFDDSKVLSQVISCGILETIRVGAVQYSSKMKYEEFLDHFQLLGDFKLENRASFKNGIDSLLKNQSVWQMGKTNIYFQSGQLAYLENLKNLKSCIVIQKYIRGWLARIKARYQLKSCIVIQKYIRGWLARIKYARIKEANLIIQNEIMINQILGISKFLITIYSEMIYG